MTIPPHELCCGRPLYDQGMLERAKWRLERAMQVLGPMVARGAKVVGLEPSCILTFRDELPMLFPGDAGAAALAGAAMGLDEFLAQHAPDFIPSALRATALVHGHCHQKALAGLAAETALLSRVDGLKFEVLDAGCCGMAGAFGYDREHFEVSKAIGSRVLIPAIENSAPDTHHHRRRLLLPLANPSVLPRAPPDASSAGVARQRGKVRFLGLRTSENCSEY